jgi:hypothetical protein
MVGAIFSQKIKKRAEKPDQIAPKSQNPASARSFARPTGGRLAKKDKF